MSSLREIASKYDSEREASARSKPISYYEIYERFFEPLRDRSNTLIELGVAEGASLKVFSEYFPKSTIVGVDIRLRDIDFANWPKIHVYEGSQTDAKLMIELATRHAPEGIDIVVDDASHQGALSFESFNILFPRLKAGGLYVIEDWGTGYWDSWTDGGLYEPPKINGSRFASHDLGMVGFVKHLVDQVGTGDIRDAHVKHHLVRAMHVHQGLVVLEKR
ncbi:MAG: hypothetical protein AAGC81_13140 [Pseudomonadota bacterium]